MGAFPKKGFTYWDFESEGLGFGAHVGSGQRIRFLCESDAIDDPDCKGFWTTVALWNRGGDTRHTKTIATPTQNPNKCTHYLRAISTKIEIISCHRMVHNKNSTDLSSGRRPLSKTDEFLL